MVVTEAGAGENGVKSLSQTGVVSLVIFRSIASRMVSIANN
jgi:hypothetical protein